MQISYLVTAEVDPSDPSLDPATIRESLVEVLSQDLVSDADGEKGAYRILAWNVSQPFVQQA